ncbi:tyrosine-type recombinase/integrase [Corallincola holothuriorum]|nr:tyrosine-type recombinase/integrase [Corallincola holothuriorum]
MSKDQYLKKRGNIWWYRRRVPASLQHLYPNQTDIIKSLHTDSLKLARLRRDEITATISAQLSSSYDPDRIRFKALVDQLRKEDPETMWELEYQGFSNKSTEDEREKDLVAAAAYNHVVHGQKEAYTQTLRETLLSWKVRNNKKPADTLNKVTQAVDSFLRHIRQNDIALLSIHKKQVVAYVESLSTDFSQSTISSRLSRLRSVWKHAYQQGDIEKERSPFHSLDLSHFSSQQGEKKQLFSALELQSILNADLQSNLHDLVRLGLYTGARIGELCNVQIEDITNTEHGYLMRIIQGKTASASRIIPIPKQACSIVTERLNSRSKGSLIELEGKDASRTFSRFKTAHITTDKARTFHSLRVHYVTAAQRAGIKEFEAASIVGHATGSTMSFGYYAKADYGLLAEAAQKIADQIDIEWIKSSQQ